MTRRELERLNRKYLLSHLEGFDVTGNLVYMRPIEWLLRMLHVDTSRWDAHQLAFRAAVQPLYLPTDQPDLTQGLDVGWFEYVPDREGEVFETVRERVVEYALPFLARFATPADYAAEPLRSLSGAVRASELETIAYSYLLAEQHREARRLLEQLATTPVPDDVRPRVRERLLRRLERVTRILELLDRDTAQALSQLREWRAVTLSHLRLPHDPV